MTITIRRSVPIDLEASTSQARIITFDGLRDDVEHFAMLFEGRGIEPPLVRIHSECVTGDVFGSLRCDCGLQLREAIVRISDEGGSILYMRQEGRGIGLTSKIDAYRLQDLGRSTYEANLDLGFPEDARTYDQAAGMLEALGFSSIRLMTNNPLKIDSIEEGGIEVCGTVRTRTYLNKANSNYLLAKRQRGHTI